MIKRYNDHSPTFTNYEPRIIEYDENGVPKKVNCDTDDEESINFAIGLENSLKEFLEDVESDDYDDNKKDNE